MEKKEKKFPHRAILLILGALLGIALLILGSTGRANKTADVPATDADPFEVYADALEAKIKTACEAVDGVSHVTVLLCFDGDFRNVFAVDEEQTTRDGVTQSVGTYVTVGSGSGESPVLVTRELPRPSGIGIICHGGNDPIVRQELTALLCATFGIGSNKIAIVEANYSD